MLPVKRFNDFIEQNDLFYRDSKILAAVSGGMDSVLLVYLLKSAGFEFGIAHCNFCLRGQESDEDQEFCIRLAKQLNVPYHSVNLDAAKHVASQKISIQMAARELRYTWFQQLKDQSGYTAIALAHHQNDAIETILLNLTRGTGIAGLHGILPKSGSLVRPLLFLARNEIETIINEEGIAFREDSSNTSTKYARNKIRLEVIPKLKELNPALESTFINNLKHFRELELLLDQKIIELKNKLFIYNGDAIHIPIDELKKLDPKRLLLFELFQPFGFNETAINNLISALDKHPGKVFEAPGYQLLLDRELLILSAKYHQEQKTIIVNLEDRAVNYANYKLTILHDDSPLILKDDPMATAVDSEKLSYPLNLRTWQKGDSFYPLGMKNRKKLSDFFIGEKVPLHQKKDIPLLVNGNGELIWIGGFRPDDRYKVNNNTKKVTIFELYKQK